jgi:hypothetical protein
VDPWPKEVAELTVTEILMAPGVVGVGFQTWDNSNAKLVVRNGALQIDYLSFNDDTNLKLRTANEATSTVGLVASLRVDSRLSVGTEAGDQLSEGAQLVVQGHDTWPLQVWRDSSTHTLGLLDDKGRLGIGPFPDGALAASLSVKGNFLAQLPGTVSTDENDHSKLIGTDTRFTQNLARGDVIKIAGKIYSVTAIASDTELTITPLPETAIKAQAVSADETLLRVLDGKDQQRMALDRSGNLSVAGALTVMGAVAAKDDLSVAGDLIAGRRLTVQGTLRLSPGSVVEGSQVIGTDLLLDGAVTKSKLSITPADIGALALAGGALGGGLTVGGDLGIGLLVPEAPLHIKSQANQALLIQDSRPAGEATSYIQWRTQNADNWSIGRDASGKLVVCYGGSKAVFTIDTDGSVFAKDFIPATNPLNHRMYPDDPQVYQDIFQALGKAIVKLGNPNYDDKTYGPNNPWNGLPMIKFGNNDQQDGNGAEITIPPDYDTVWVRVRGDRWNVIKAYYLDRDQEDLGLWVGGLRRLNSYSPDGSPPDEYWDFHQWIPIPAGRAGRLALISKPHTNDNFWISGLAFSKNPWAHATQSARGYNWSINGGSGVEWADDSWNNDVLGKIPETKVALLKVPIVPSGRDKLLYMIEHNSNWNSALHTGIGVNGSPIERFLTTYDNPFARHWGTKPWCRYLAARVPASLISNSRYIDVTIDMSRQNRPLNFREVGTHDLDVPRR